MALSRGLGLLHAGAYIHEHVHAHAYVLLITLKSPQAKRSHENLIDLYGMTRKMAKMAMIDYAVHWPHWPRGCFQSGCGFQ